MFFVVFFLFICSCSAYIFSLNINCCLWCIKKIESSSGVGGGWTFHSWSWHTKKKKKHEKMYNNQACVWFVHINVSRLYPLNELKALYFVCQHITHFIYYKQPVIWPPSQHCQAKDYWLILYEIPLTVSVSHLRALGRKSSEQLLCDLGHIGISLSNRRMQLTAL